MPRRGGVASLDCRVVGAHELGLQWVAVSDNLLLAAARKAALVQPINYDECDLQKL